MRKGARGGSRGKKRKDEDGMEMATATVEDNVVERALSHVGGSLSELGRRLSEYAGKEITRQRVFGWRQRGVFPREMLVYVHRLAGIPTEQLLMAQPKKLARGSVVDRAISKAGGTAQKFAAALAKQSGRKITRQMVNGWQAREQFPRDLVIDVHMLTKIPVEDLIAR
jgi:hypothetical protein